METRLKHLIWQMGIIKQKLKAWLSSHGIPVGLTALLAILVGAISNDMLVSRQAEVPTIGLSSLEQNFGPCKVSPEEIELTLTVISDNNETGIAEHDRFCPQALINGNNLLTYRTTSGIRFDADIALDIRYGDIVTVKGPYYIAAGKHMILYGRTITPIKVVERPRYPRPTQTPGTSIQITPTPRPY